MAPWCVCVSVICSGKALLLKEAADLDFRYCLILSSEVGRGGGGEGSGVGIEEKKKKCVELGGMELDMVSILYSSSDGKKKEKFIR